MQQHGTLFLPMSHKKATRLIWVKDTYFDKKNTWTQSKKDGNDQESIQSSSTSDPGYDIVIRIAHIKQTMPRANWNLSYII